VYRNQIMFGRRIDFRSAIDGLLLAVPPILLIIIIPKHAVGIALTWIFDHPGTGIGGYDAVSLMFFGIYVGGWILAFAATRSLIPRTDRWVPLRLTPARLVLTLLLTLFAIALAVIDMMFRS
jgi:hypothetical protein